MPRPDIIPSESGCLKVFDLHQDYNVGQLPHNKGQMHHIHFVSVVNKRVG